MSGLTISKLTPEFRVSFPKVFEPELNTLSNKLEFKLVAMFDKAAQGSAEFKELKEAIVKCIVDEFGNDKAKWPKKLKLPLHDGNEKYEEDPVKYAMYKDVVYVNLKSKDKPVVRTPDNKNYITDTNEFYGGCYARASVNVKAFQYPAVKPMSHGVSMFLNGLLKTRDGEAFGGRANVESMFDSVAVASSAEDNIDDPLAGLGGPDSSSPRGNKTTTADKDYDADFDKLMGM